MNILIVEDEVNLANTLTRALKGNLGSGTYVEHCRTAEIALDKLAAKQYDFLISDWHLPGMSGLKLIASARRNYPHIKIIFMTAYLHEETSGKVMEIADKFFSKPFPVSALVDNIHTLSQELVWQP